MKFKIPKLFKHPKHGMNKKFDEIFKKLRYVGLTLDLMVIEKKLWREFPDRMYKISKDRRKRILREELEKLQKI